MRRFNITVNGRTYQVDVEEVGGVVSSAPVAAPVYTAPAAPAPAPVAAAPAPAAAAPAPAPAPKPAAPKAAPAGGETISSPMPGTILAVNVKVGDKVKQGDVMFILEAMKMENEIMAPRDAEVVDVGVSKGASVNTGDMLVVLA